MTLTLTNVSPVRASLRDFHNVALMRLHNLSVPTDLQTYESAGERAAWQAHMLTYQRSIADAVCTLLDEAADRVVDETGARRESIEILRAAFTDFIDAQEPSDG